MLTTLTISAPPRSTNGKAPAPRTQCPLPNAQSQIPKPQSHPDASFPHSRLPGFPSSPSRSASPDLQHLLDLLLSPTLSLRDVAASAGLSLTQLAQHADRLADALEPLRRLAEERARAIAADARAAALGALHSIVDAHALEERNLPYGNNLQSINTRLRARDIARKAASLIDRMNRPLTPAAHTAHHPHCNTHTPSTHPRPSAPHNPTTAPHPRAPSAPNPTPHHNGMARSRRAHDPQARADGSSNPTHQPRGSTDDSSNRNHAPPNTHKPPHRAPTPPNPRHELLTRLQEPALSSQHPALRTQDPGLRTLSASPRPHSPDTSTQISHSPQELRATRRVPLPTMNCFDPCNPNHECRGRMQPTALTVCINHPG